MRDVQVSTETRSEIRMKMLLNLQLVGSDCFMVTLYVSNTERNIESLLIIWLHVRYTQSVIRSAFEKSKSLVAIRTTQGVWVAHPNPGWPVITNVEIQAKLKLSDIANCIPWNNPPPPLKKKGQFICIYKFNYLNNEYT